MSSFNLFKGTELDNVLWQTFKVLPTVYEDALSYLEQVAKLVQHVNDDRGAINTVAQAVENFEVYVVGKLSEYEESTTTQVQTMLNNFVTNGTLANLINNTLLSSINSSIGTLQTTVEDITYKQAVVTLSIQPSQLIYNKGESVNSVILNTATVQGTKTPTQLKFYKNDVLINSKTTGITLSDSFVDGSIITGNATYYVELLDGKTTVRSNTVTINFVNNFYSGLISDTATVNETLIKSLTTDKTIKSNLTKTYSPNLQRILFSYPASYGSLTSITVNEDNIKDGFTMTVVPLVLNSVSVDYNVYVSNNPIIDNSIILEFKF